MRKDYNSITQSNLLKEVKKGVPTPQHSLTKRHKKAAQQHEVVGINPNIPITTVKENGLNDVIKRQKKHSSELARMGLRQSSALLPSWGELNNSKSQDQARLV